MTLLCGRNTRFDDDVCRCTLPSPSYAFPHIKLQQEDDEGDDKDIMMIISSAPPPPPPPTAPTVPPTAWEEHVRK